MDRRSNGDMRVGNLVKTWHRLVCHARSEAKSNGDTRYGSRLGRERVQTESENWACVKG